MSRQMKGRFFSSRNIYHIKKQVLVRIEPETFGVPGVIVTSGQSCLREKSLVPDCNTYA